MHVIVDAWRYPHTTVIAITTTTACHLFFFSLTYIRKWIERGLTHTVQPPAAQSPRRFPRAKSDRHHQTLTYLVGPQHRESRRANFTSSIQLSSQGCEKTTGPLLLTVSSSLTLSLSLSPLVPPFSRSHSFSRTLSSFFLARSFVRSYARSLVRPTAHSTPGRGRGDKQRAFYQTRLRSRHDISI